MVLNINSLIQYLFNESLFSKSIVVLIPLPEYLVEIIDFGISVIKNDRQFP